ncbi:MAG: hypothetical protein AAFZ01_14825, partial [Pseudomonadota bacterium]
MIDKNGRTGARRRGAPVTQRSGRKPAPVYLGRAGRNVPDVYLTELGNGSKAARAKFLVSTCLAGLVGICAIFFAIYGSMEDRNGRGVLETITHASDTVFQGAQTERRIKIRQLRRVAPKSDRLQASASGTATKHIIHESVRQRRNNREFIKIKPYARIVARLAIEQPERNDLIPTFNPFKLYAATKSGGTRKSASGNKLGGGSEAVSVRILELVGGILPADDGLELNATEVADLVARADEEFRTPLEGTSSADEATTSASSGGTGADYASLPNTTVLEKTVFESLGATSGANGQEVRIIRVSKGDTLVGLVRRAGAENWQARAINEQVAKTLKKSKLRVGQEVHMTLVPSPTRALALEPVRVALYAPGHRHKVTVWRDDGGDYRASTKPRLAG